MTTAEILKQLNWRSATKIFDPNKKISDADLENLLEVLRLTPSSYGLQPWKFVVVKNPEIKTGLLEASYNQKQVTDASHLIVLCSQKEVTLQDVDHYLETTMKIRGVKAEELAGLKTALINFITKKNPDEIQTWAQKQVYIALGNLLTACALASIDACPMEGFETEKYNKILGLDKLGYSATVVCPIGYRSEKEIIRKKVRFDKSELILEV